MASQIDQRIIALLVATNRISEEDAREKGVDEILGRIQRTFSHESESERLTPDRKVGKLFQYWREEAGLSQALTREKLCAEFSGIGAIGIAVSNQSAISRIERGSQTLTYPQAMAFARVIERILGRDIPRGFLSPWESDLRNPHIFAELSIESN